MAMQIIKKQPYALKDHPRTKGSLCLQNNSEHFEKTGEITVIVQDNHPIHTSKQVREYWDKWQQQGLFFFQLPKYS